MASYKIRDTEGLDELGWRQARFTIDWDGTSQPKWEADLLLAREVVKPVLETWRDEIGLWRFHRRAQRDADGHVFSFHLYSSEGVARSVFHDVESQRTLTMAKEAGLCQDGYLDTPTTGVEGETEEYWPAEIRRAWPYFIVGVCDAWLRLVEEVARKHVNPAETNSVAELLIQYGKVNEEVSWLWSERGCHPFLHNLNAVFGYTPIVVGQTVHRQIVTFQG